jgi:predicted  nucleic acid-binding Zn-ribbon protein
MVGGRGFIPGQNEVNLALAPSQTGSSIKMYILAAALQAGATPDDIIDGRRGCRLPNPGNNVDPIFAIDGGVAGGVFSLREHTSRSINCAFARLSQIVGLNRVVDTTYRMSASTYLYQGQPASQRQPIQPFASFATGANEMSTLDMAVGMQTMANRGIHHNPYYVQHIDDAEGRRIYTHVSAGTRVLDEAVALTAIDIMKDTLLSGTGRSELQALAQQRPMSGKTGTQQNNTTAFFVGATPFLTTAVLVRDPDRYTAMVNVPEFVEQGVPRVQGGTYPARIWGAFMEPAHAFEPVTDWPEPPPPVRPAARLYLPGNECLFRTVAAPVAEPEEPAGRRGHRAGGATSCGAARRTAAWQRAARRARGAGPTAAAADRADRERHHHRTRRARPVPPVAVGTGQRHGGSVSLIDQLLALQEADTAADQLRHRLTHLPELEAARHAHREMVAWEAERTRLRNRLDELTEVIETSEAQSADIDRHRARLDAQLKTVIAPREAEALQHEIAVLEERRSELDDGELAALEEQASVDDTLVAHVARDSSLRAAVEQSDAALAAVQGDIERELSELDATRERVRAELDDATRARYDRLRKHLGVAVARLVGHRCDGCHMDLSPVEVDLVKATPEGEPAACPQCDRLLVR